LVFSLMLTFSFSTKNELSGALRSDSLRVARNSYCPLALWKDLTSRFIFNHSMVMVNVGANKGYAVQSFLATYGGETWPSASAWKRALLEEDQGLWRPCGACSACKAPSPASVHNASKLHVYALEFMSRNAKLLQRMFDRFKIPGAVFHAAVSDGRQRKFREPPVQGVAVGDERWGVDTHALLREDRKWVSSFPLDEFARKAGIVHVSHLSSDTEGHDNLVLRGASQLIAHKRIDLIEFEYHGQGAWKTGPNLKETLAWLLHSGYECFWQGNHGRVVPASGPFWQAAYEFKGWSNLLCSHKADVLLQLYKLSVVGSGEQ